MIERLLRIALAYLAACLAAGFAMAVEVMLLGFVVPLLEGRSPSHAPVLASPTYSLVLVTWLTGILATIYAFLPAAIAIAIAEVRRQHSAAFYGGAGIVVAVAALAIFMHRSSLGMPYRGEALLAGIAGLAGGLVYWRIAGRTAGAWRVTS